MRDSGNVEDRESAGPAGGGFGGGGMKLGGVGLDVLSVEPPPADHPLCDGRAPWAARVVVTPHIGWGAIEARRRLAAAATENLRAFFAGTRLNRVD